MSLVDRLQRFFRPFDSHGGTLPPALGTIKDEKALTLSLKELTRLVDQQWQASDQLAQRAGVLLGVFVAIVAAIIAVTKTLPSHLTLLWGFTIGVLLFAFGCALYSTKAHNIRIAPSDPDIVNLAPAKKARRAKHALLGFRLTDLQTNASVLNDTSTAYVLAILAFPVGVLLLVRAVI